MVSPFGPGFPRVNGRYSTDSNDSTKLSEPSGLPVRSCFLIKFICSYSAEPERKSCQSPVISSNGVTRTSLSSIEGNDLVVEADEASHCDHNSGAPKIPGVHKIPPQNSRCIESLIGRPWVVRFKIFTTLLETKVLIENWRREYNHPPHSSLCYRPPSSTSNQYKGIYTAIYSKTNLIQV